MCFEGENNIPHTIPTSFYRFHLYLKYWLPRGFFFGSLYAWVLAKYASPFHIYSWLLVVVVVVNTHFFLTVNMLLNAILHTYITFQYLSIFDEPKTTKIFEIAKWNKKHWAKYLIKISILKCYFEVAMMLFLALQYVSIAEKWKFGCSFSRNHLQKKIQPYC